MSAQTKLCVYAQVKRNSKTLEAELNQKGVEIVLTDYLPSKKRNTFSLHPGAMSARNFWNFFDIYLANRTINIGHAVASLSDVECLTIKGPLVLVIYGLGDGWVQIAIWRRDTEKVFEMNLRESEITRIFKPISDYFSL